VSSVVSHQKHERILPTVRYLYDKQAAHLELIPQPGQNRRGFWDVLEGMDQRDNVELTGDLSGTTGVKGFDAWNRLHGRFVVVSYVQAGKRPAGGCLAKSAKSSAVTATYVQQAPVRRER
jgi:hypothetical protein